MPASQNAKIAFVLPPRQQSPTQSLRTFYLPFRSAFRLASGPPCHDTLGGIALSLRSVMIIAYIHPSSFHGFFWRSRGPLFLHNYIACLLDQFLYLFMLEIAAAALVLYFCCFGGKGVQICDISICICPPPAEGNCLYPIFDLREMKICLRVWLRFFFFLFLSFLILALGNRRGFSTFVRSSYHCLRKKYISYALG